MDDSAVFNAGVYIRLSQEDEAAGQSESIKNQQSFVCGFVRQHGWQIGGVYADDGWSGTSFDRPGFKSLLNDIESRKINMVVTKDLSRLGRDYIETGHYLERYFPFHNVRYIAITDGVDTFDERSSGNDIMPFKAVMNDMYSRDISKKIRATMDDKRRNGQFIGAFAPFGYIKDPCDKNRLIIDEEAAEVVRRIFALCLNGASVSGVARVLNGEHVLPPSEYKKLYCAYVNANARCGAWRRQTVRDILSNPVYIGNLAQGKNTKISYKSNRYRKIRRDRWIVVENTHEPIVERDTFEIAQTMLSKRAAANHGSFQPGHLLAGMLFCGDCGLPITFRRSHNNQFVTICSNYSRFGKCRRHAVYEEELNGLVVSDLKDISKRHIDCEAFAGQFALSAPGGRPKPLAKDKAASEKRLPIIKTALKRLYEDRASGIIGEDDFISLVKSFNAEKAALVKRREAPDAMPTDGQEARVGYMRAIQELAAFDTTNKALLAQLIDRIDLFETGETPAGKEYRVAVRYAFSQP